MPFSKLFLQILIPLSTIFFSVYSHADTADVVSVNASQASDKTWSFHVTVKHTDTGWEDYANAWDVVLPDGQVLKKSESDQFTRLLFHPHVNEQPFTRSQSGLVIPGEVKKVIVRVHTTVEGWGGKEMEVNLAGK